MSLFNKTLSFFAFSTLVAIYPLSARVRGNIYVDESKEFQLVTAEMMDVHVSDIEGTLEYSIKMENPSQLKGQQLKILVMEENENLRKLLDQSKRIAFRVHTRVFRDEIDFLYDNEMADAFAIDKIPSSFRCPSDLDRLPKTPRNKRPKFPKNLPDDFVQAVASYVVFVDENGTMRKAVPLIAAGEPFDQLTLDFVNSTKFEIGKANQKPVPYFQLIMIRFIVDGFLPYK